MNVITVDLATTISTLCTVIINFAMFVYFQVQLTDFENAAYVVFIVLLTRVILSFNLDIMVPISKVRSQILPSLFYKFMSVWKYFTNCVARLDL